MFLNSEALAGVNNPGSAGVASPFNGGLTQVNSTNAQNAGTFIFMNFMKSAQEWSYSGGTPTSGPPQPILELDANGYPTSIVAGTTGVFTVVVMPTPAEESGNWVLDWVGTGTLSIAGLANTPISGSLTGTNGQYIFSLQAGGTLDVGITATSAAPNNVQNVRLYRQVDQTALNNGAIFFPPHIAMMKSARPGVIRSLGWGGGFNGTNDAHATTWATRRPTTYVTYEGGVYNPAWWAGGTGTTTNIGSDYTLASTGFSLTNKVIIQLLFNANAPQSANTTVTFSTTSGNPINIVWTGHGLSANNAVTMGTGLPAALTAATTYFIKTVVDANTFTVSATRGGTVINAGANASGSCTACSIPMININSTGFVSITGIATPQPGNIFVGFNTQLPQTGIVSTLVYDSTIGYFYLANGNFINGGPPEVFAAYCAAVGAHPHIVSPFLSMEPLTDYMTQWVTYIKNTYPWMKPRVEPPNECWNGGSAFLSTFYATSLSYVLWASQSDPHNAYGKWCSVLGQAISAIYGNDRTKYSIICAVQAGAFNASSTPGAAQDARLKSTLYVSVNSGLPAYNWVDRVCTATYYSPSERLTCQELIDAYAYSVTNAGNPTAQATIANNYASSASFASGNTPFTLAWEDANFTNLCTWAKAMPGGNTIAGVTAYEGGWSPDFLQGNWSTNITAATNANPCVLTLASTSQNSENSGMTGNPAVVGMQITLSGFTGGFATFNGQTVNITGVSGNSITTNLNASGQGSAFAGSALATYVNSQTYSNTLRLAGGNSTQAGTLNTAMYTLFAAHASSGFVAEYPSNFIYFGSGTVWPVLQPDIYAPLTPQWNSIVAFN